MSVFRGKEQSGDRWRATLEVPTSMNMNGSGTGAGSLEKANSRNLLNADPGKTYLFSITLGYS